jgi:hypothetical protein
MRGAPASLPIKERAAAQAGEGKLRVFIAYSRDDVAFADQLYAALEVYGFEPVLDRHSISGGEDWKRRLGALIQEADTVQLVLSPASAVSEVCAWEVEEATRLSKRILPVVCRPLDGASPHQRLRNLDYIFFYAEPRAPGGGFGAGPARLVHALNTDIGWLREHTHLALRAASWDAGGRPVNRLLSGDDIAEAKAWVARRPKDAPEPTALHLDFILAGGKEMAVLEGFAAAFSDDGRRVITMSGGTIRTISSAWTSIAELIDAGIARVPRCLSEEERRDLFLADEAPAWCHARAKWSHGPR